jgi:hypothetical protein
VRLRTTRRGFALDAIGDPVLRNPVGARPQPAVIDGAPRDQPCSSTYAFSKIAARLLRGRRVVFRSALKFGLTLFRAEIECFATVLRCKISTPLVNLHLAHWVSRHTLISSFRCWWLNVLWPNGFRHSEYPRCAVSANVHIREITRPNPPTPRVSHRGELVDGRCNCAPID